LPYAAAAGLGYSNTEFWLSLKIVYFSQSIVVAEFSWKFVASKSGFDFDFMLSSLFISLNEELTELGSIAAANTYILFSIYYNS
jgi:hypothetical protein